MTHVQLNRVLLDDTQLTLLRGLRGARLDAVFSDGVCGFRFCLDAIGWEARTVELPVLSQNRTDELLGVRLHPGSGSVLPGEGEKLIGRHVGVMDVAVVRGVVWFTDHVTYKSPRDAVEGFAPPRNETDQRLHEMLLETTGGHEEVVTHPTRMDEIEASVANLADVGFVARTEIGDLACFAWWNSFIRDADFITDENRNDVLAHYELRWLDAGFRAE